MGYDVNRFQEDVEDFLCPVCFDVLNDPIELKKCEHIFCRHCIVKWFHEHPTCPVDREQIKESHLRQTSRFFRQQYSRLKIRCQYVGKGCAELVPIVNITEHESICVHNDDNKPTAVNELHTVLIESLKINGKISSRRVERAMLSVDRGLFCAANPYVDEAQRIEHGATISAPHIHASILMLLRSRLTKDAKVLDIGSGSGYLTICMASMLESDGKVIGIDHVSQLVNRSKTLVREHFSRLNERIEFIATDGRQGHAAGGPYDVINIGGAVDKLSQYIYHQLKPNGRIIVPLRYAQGQKLVSIDKMSNGEMKMTIRGGVRFGSITDLGTQLNCRRF